MLKRFLCIVLSIDLVASVLSGCSLDFRHVEVSEQDNTNSNIDGWDDIASPDIENWDTVNIASWEQVDIISSPVYSTLLYDDNVQGYPLVECVILDYQSNGVYFEGEKVYSLVGNKYDLNNLETKFAVGTGVIIVCFVVTVATSGGSMPVVCYVATQALEASVLAASGGTIFGSATSAVMNYINSGADWQQTLYGTLEGAADGYMWGAIFGAAEGTVTGITTAGEVRYFQEGTPQAEKYPGGIRYDQNGYPRFEDYKIAEAKFDFPSQDGLKNKTCLSGSYSRDAALANKQCGYKSTPEGYVWHHVEDMQTMILVPQEIHSIVFGGMAHKGGASLIRHLLFPEMYAGGLG